MQLYIRRAPYLVRIILVQVVAAHLNSELGSGHAAGWQMLEARDLRDLEKTKNVMT